MSRASTVEVRPIDPRRLKPLIGKERVDALLAAAATSVSCSAAPTHRERQPETKLTAYDVRF